MTQRMDIEVVEGVEEDRLALGVSAGNAVSYVLTKGTARA